MKTLKTIVMTNELLADKIRLGKKLARLYRGKKETYLIYMNLAQLPLVENIFDSIIRDHGILDVQFQYQLRT